MNQFISDKLRRKVGLHNLMLYSYIMCSNRRVTVLVFFCLLITFWGIKFIILKLKLEINAWSFIFYLYIFFFILWSLRNWSEYFCYIFGILRIWVLTLVFKVLFEGGNLISIHLLYFNISSGILLRFGRKYKISDFFKEKNSCYEFCLLNELHLHFPSIFQNLIICAILYKL